MNAFAESDRRVVITGMGVLSPAGIGADEFWTNLAAGNSGIKPIELLAASACPDNIGGEVSGFNSDTIKKQFLKEKEQRKSIKVMCREIQMGAASALMAVEQAGLDLASLDHERVGIDFGANLMCSPPDDLKDGCFQCVDDTPANAFLFEKWGTKGLQRMDPLWLLRYLPNMPACHIAIFLDARGPSNSLTHDEASANLAIAEASRIILRGSADVMITGSTGTRVHAVRSMHAALWDQLASEGDAAGRCRPFDASRSGQVPGEAACSLVLEEEQHAIARGATIYGRIIGTGSSCVVNGSQSGNVAQAIAVATRLALEKAGIKAEDVGHINANGLGSVEADLAEARGIHEIFGSYGSQVPVTALKSFTGNSGSGCGAMELAGSLLGLQQGVIPFTLNSNSPDPDCNLNVVHGEPLKTDNKIVLNINSTRMGQAGAVLVQGV